jgi:membrane protease YdiL (CAAX protease family)
MDAQVMLVGYFLYCRNPATADCGILVLRRINLGEVFRFDNAGPSGRPPGSAFWCTRAPLVFAAGFFVNGWWNAKQDQQDVMTIFEQSKSDAQRVPMFPATVIAAPGAEEQVFRGYL